MTSVVSAVHMYNHSSLDRRHSFKGSSPPYVHDPSMTSAWPAYPLYHSDFTRALTPPPDMNGVHPPLSRSTAHPYDHGSHYADYMSTALHAGPASSTAIREYPHADTARREAPARFYSRSSPARRPSMDASSDTQSISQSRRGSQASNSIAPNFQIPRSVNDSGGSLSELAAQITCLFWFESSDLLQRIEDSTVPLPPTRPLSSDAMPTTGFRKWVTTILLTTCVAQNVIVLALLFIYRLKKLNPTVRGKPGSEYRLLTVALMLGNKFLDDNTYTNKTWAEVSGINVSEVHIMEVEFLSNMKYDLFTSEQDWSQWQVLLGKFATFFERASRQPPAAPTSAAALPPTVTNRPMALPSPPASTEASPPYTSDAASTPAYTANIQLQHGLTPAPSPHPGAQEPYFSSKTQASMSRKRNHDDASYEPPSKRAASSVLGHTAPQRHSTSIPRPQLQPVPPSHSASRMFLPNILAPEAYPVPTPHPQVSASCQPLPPLAGPVRATGLVYPADHNPPVSQEPVRVSQPLDRMPAQSRSQHTSPSADILTPAVVALHPPTQISPTHYLQQRNSPYRPVHHVSTLLHPSVGAFQSRPSNIELNQMHYQPLAKSTQMPQTGRLPYVAQNLWLDGHQPQQMTPIHQWPGFTSAPA